MKKLNSMLAGIVLAFGAAGTALADTIALTFSGGTSYAYVTEPTPNTVGWQFTLSSAVTVTSLGFYDVDQDGLAASHSVAIWDSGLNQVVSGSVSGTDALDGGFRWDDVAPVTLAAGTYLIGALVSGSDDYYFSSVTSIATASPVTYDGGAYLTGGFGAPVNVGFTNNGRFGPNFQFVTTPVPEPEIYAMMAAGLGMLGFASRRRKKAAA